MEEHRQPRNAGDDPRYAGRVATVAGDSPAADAGIMAGDTLVSIDGHKLRDIIDYQFILEPGIQQLLLDRNGQQLELTLEHGDEDPGISFHSAIFDRVRTCACNCIFCFVDQLPAGLRPSLYIRDDDFRLSFLCGNFITLNNLDGEDLDRIIDQRLSPLYVSVHATDTAVRARLMGVREQVASRGLEVLKQLGQAGIETHIQVVLCPGINDDAVLESTVTDLANDFQGVASVGVVPVSVSGKYQLEHRAIGLRPVNKKESQAAISTIKVMQDHLRKTRGNGFVYAADEFYLLAESPLPGPEAYDGFPQYENGIGIGASFLENLGELRERLTARTLTDGDIYLLTGTLAAEMVESACAGLARQSPAVIRPLIARNSLFGTHVTVTGLLGGKDIIEAATKVNLGRLDLLLLPSLCLSSEEQPRFLDGITLEEINEILPCTVVPVEPI